MITMREKNKNMYKKTDSDLMRGNKAVKTWHLRSIQKKRKKKTNPKHKNVCLLSSVCRSASQAAKFDTNTYKVSYSPGSGHKNKVNQTNQTNVLLEVCPIQTISHYFFFLNINSVYASLNIMTLSENQENKFYIKPLPLAEDK